jgi:hypothetical protein
MTNRNRRRFLKTVVAAGVVLAPPAAVQAGEPAAAAPQQALGDFVRARFGEHLNAKQLQEARTEVNDMLRTADTIRRVALENADEPVVVFLAELEE